MKIRFITGHTVNLGEGNRFAYEKGSEHEFVGMVNETYARKYIRRGWAEEVIADPLDHDGDGKTGGSNPAAPGEKVLSAGELLAALTADPPMEWFTFKAEAKKILGDATPARKDEIVAALQALVPPADEVVVSEDAPANE